MKKLLLVLVLVLLFAQESQAFGWRRRVVINQFVGPGWYAPAPVFFSPSPWGWSPGYQFSYPLGFCPNCRRW